MKKAILLALIIISVASKTGAYTIYTVTKTNDPDPYTHPYTFDDSHCDPEMYGTFQWAIRKSLETPGECKIHFNIAGNGPYTINLSYALPPLEKKPIFIDGSTQPGYSPGNPIIQIDGLYKQVSGLYFNNNKSSGIRAIVFQHFISQAVIFNYCDLYQISDCIFTENGSGDSKIEPAAIRIIHSTNGTITGNKIGVDFSGHDIGNKAFGIVLTDFSNSNTIGGVTADKQNFFAKNNKIGIWVTKESQFNNITGNIFYGQDVAISLDGNGNQNKVSPEIVEYISNSGLLSGYSTPLDSIEVFGSMGPEMSNVFLGKTITDNNGKWALANTFTTYENYTTTATDQLKNTSRLSKAFAKPTPIFVDFTINPDTANIGQSITFTNISSFLDTTQNYFVWAFEMPANDSSNINVIKYDTLVGHQSIVQQYNRAGTYLITLYLINSSLGIIGSKEKSLTIKQLGPGLEIFRNGTLYDAINPFGVAQTETLEITICEGDVLDFVLDGDVPPLDSWWQFGGGPCENIPGGLWQIGMPATFNCAFNGVVGNCTLNVQVGNRETNDVYYIFEIYIHVIGPPRQEYFVISPPSPTNICPGEHVNISYIGNTADYPINFETFNIFWGDNEYGNMNWPTTHEYNECGSYNLTISASNMCGSMPEVQYPVIVELKPDFQEKNLCLGESFCSSGTHSCPQSSISNGTLEWSWDFGDGSSVFIGQDPCHNYTVAGSYLVTLTLKLFIEGEFSCMGSISKQITVSPLPPEIEISGAFQNCNSGNENVSHYSISSTQTGVQYLWQFPLGNGYFIGSNPSSPNEISGIGLDNVDIVWNNLFNQNHFELVVIATNLNTGCQTSDTLMIYQCCRPAQNQQNDIIWTDQILNSSLNLSNSNIYVNGVVYLKEESVFSKCDFFMGPDSRIIISDVPFHGSDPVVNMIECNLKSCDGVNVWDGIFIIDPNAQLFMQQKCTTIEARNAIVSEKGGKYNIRGCYFDLNWKTLCVKPYDLPNNSIFIGNTITCSNSTNMLFPFNNRRSFVGVEIENNAYIIIGSSNSFSNLGMGIHVVGSNTIIKGNNFSNILLAPMQFTKAAIWVQGNSPGFITTVQDGNVFDKCYEGIIAESGTDITIIDNKFLNISHNAIYYQKLKGNNVVISRNTIINAGNGIFAYRPSKSTSTISFNTISWTTNSVGTGIKFFGTNDVDEKVTVGLLNDINVTKANKGIWMMNVEKPVIDNNIITVQNKSNSWLVQRAIHLQDCAGASVTDNRITATGNPTATNTSYGISIELSGSSSILCNNITKTGFAIQAASACPGSKIYNNSMKQAYYGFTLTSGGVVGPQGSSTYLSDNTWTGVTYNFWSFCSNGLASQFNVRSTPASFNPSWSDTWKTCIASATAIKPNIYSASFGSIRPCEMVWPHPIGDLIPLRQIAQNQSITYLNDVSEIWLSKKALRKIIKYDTILQHDPVLWNYYDSTKTQSIGLLDSVLYQLRNEEFGTASILNNMIPDTNSLERNEKRVNEIELSHLMTSCEYSDNEINELRELAIKCPYNEGKAVYRARTLLAEVDSFNTEYINDCEQMMALELRSSEAISDSSTENAKFAIYPNPSNGIITITCSKEDLAKQYHFEMFNMVGQSMKTTSIIFTAQSAEINIDELSNGVYYYRLSDQNGSVDSGKIVLLKP